MGDIGKDIDSKFKDEWIKAYSNVIYTANWFKHISERHFSPYGLSPQQYNVLRILRGAKTAITVNTVRNRMMEKTPNITRLMDKLVTKNLIKRTRSETDRRTVFVGITSAGLELLDDIVIDENQYGLVNKITEAEARELNRILDKIR